MSVNTIQKNIHFEPKNPVCQIEFSADIYTNFNMDIRRGFFREAIILPWLSVLDLNRMVPMMLYCVIYFFQKLILRFSGIQLVASNFQQA